MRIAPEEARRIRQVHRLEKLECGGARLAGAAAAVQLHGLRHLAADAQVRRERTQRVLRDEGHAPAAQALRVPHRRARGHRSPSIRIAPEVMTPPGRQ